MRDRHTHTLTTPHESGVDHTSPVQLQSPPQNTLTGAPQRGIDQREEKTTRYRGPQGRKGTESWKKNRADSRTRPQQVLRSPPTGMRERTESRTRLLQVLRSPSKGSELTEGQMERLSQRDKTLADLPNKRDMGADRARGAGNEEPKRVEGTRTTPLVLKVREGGHSDKQWNKSPEGASHRAHDKERPRCLAARPPGNGSRPQLPDTGRKTSTHDLVRTSVHRK